MATNMFFEREEAGVADIMTPFDPEPAMQRCRSHPAVTPRLLEELGFGEQGPRWQLREQAYAEFARCNGGRQMDMTEERFIAMAAQLFLFDRRSARACFHASDLDCTARLDKDQYLLLKEAFVHGDTEYSKHEEILAMRLRAVFHKYVVTRPAMRHVHDTALTEAEALMWVRDLCAGETHVKQVAAKLLPAMQAEASNHRSNHSDAMTLQKSKTCSLHEHSINMDSWVRTLAQGNFQETLQQLGLSMNDVLASITAPSSCPGQPVHAFSRAVLDGRAETAILKWSGADSFPPEVGVPNRTRGMQSSYVPNDAVNEEMQLDPLVRAVGGWRGPMAASRESEEYEVAHNVLEAAMKIARDTAREEDCLDRNWMTNGEALEAMLGASEQQQAYNLRLLATSCRKQLEAEPPLVRVAVPAKVFGDIHGQFRDLLMMFQQFGFPFHCGGDIQTTSYVFNGDFVDRGEHQLEVIAILFALKAIYPAHAFLVRGNHEFRDMSELPSGNAFKKHVRWRLPTQWPSVYEAVHSTFDWLPFAAQVGGRVLVLHGGLGDGSWGLKDLERIQRPIKHVSNSFVLDVVWSDPSDSDHVMYKGVHENPDRGDEKVHLFGPDVTEEFCKREGLNIIIRSHQYVPQGYKVMHGGHMITLFSARNYVGQDENDSALLLLAPDRNGHLRVHPKTLLALPLPLDADEFDDDVEQMLSGSRSTGSLWISVTRSLSSSCGECLQFLRTGTRAKPQRKSGSLYT
mmetsp:Transcript_116371/g.336116  ORF Transcript_116371/g.336116 Transcript_116371/m.336116 type:complete len:742 (+) Transcript_116371:81-2306(+)